ncbi:proton-coupled folate transporter-like [Pseudophryne corroboree]|uniref:proton-coupled folate transporter-like n=1 Tax=Pseudophryne corroboree TaxID=495146 RepID=UPI003081ABDA
MCNVCGARKYSVALSLAKDLMRSRLTRYCHLFALLMEVYLHVMPQTMWNNLRSILTVEPVVFLFMTAIFLQTPAYQQLILNKVCQESYNDSICEDIQQNKDEFKAVQSRGSYIMLIYIAIISLLAILPALILGAWSDKGNRKVGMILPCFFSIGSGGLFIAIHYVKEISVYWTFGAAALNGISGGHVSIFLSAFSYLADITEDSNRTFRMGIAESMIFIGGTCGFLLSGTLLQHSTFAVLFGVYCACNFLAALYVLLWIQDSKPSGGFSQFHEDYQGSDNDYDEEKKSPSRKTILTYIKESFQTVSKKREGHNRQKIHLILLCIFLINICNVGEQSISLMFVSYPPRSFNNELYGWYTGSKMLISGICLLCSFHWLLKHVKETSLANIGVIMRTISFLLMAFSTTKWMIFLSGILHAPSGYTVAVLRSLSSKIAHPNEQGAMFSIMASVETTCLLIGAAIFNGLYPATLSTFPGMCFIIMATFMMITFVLIHLCTCLMYLQKLLGAMPTTVRPSNCRVLTLSMVAMSRSDLHNAIWKEETPTTICLSSARAGRTTASPVADIEIEDVTVDQDEEDMGVAGAAEEDDYEDSDGDVGCCENTGVLTLSMVAMSRPDLHNAIWKEETPTTICLSSARAGRTTASPVADIEIEDVTVDQDEEDMGVAGAAEEDDYEDSDGDVVCLNKAPVEKVVGHGMKKPTVLPGHFTIGFLFNAVFITPTSLTDPKDIAHKSLTQTKGTV